MDEGESVEIIQSYTLDASGTDVNVRIYTVKDEYVPIYEVTIPGIGTATKLLLMSFRPELISTIPLDTTRLSEKEYREEMRNKYIETSTILIEKYLPGTNDNTKQLLISYIINMMLGLGDLEVPLSDPNLEEIVINSSKDYIWVFHRKYYWCKTNIKLRSEEEIYEKAEQIGRGVGREINNLAPLMDAELMDGSRVNATLFPISQNGNTITIRKFTKNPWTMPALVRANSISPNIAGLIWACIENEISLLIAGGTASGKTSFLNAMSIFFPPNRRIISVEETRELTLPNFLQWVPMVTRSPNPEGKGEITLHDLTINALRQRPDIIVVGEIRVQKDAETMFEAIHTGHSVYGTVHADNAADAIIRMSNPPIDIPKIVLNALGGIIVQFRHRAKGIRRVLEFAEILKTGDSSVYYRWNIRNDTFSQVGDIIRLSETLSLYTGLTKREIEDDVLARASVLQWMANNNVTTVDDSGNIVANYYRNKSRVLQAVADNAPYTPDLFK